MADLHYKACYIKRAGSRDRIDVNQPIDIVMSDQTMDRDREIVMGFKNLKQFMRDNPVLRFMHMPGAIVGKMTRAAQQGTKTVGSFLLAEAGTSQLVDEVRSMVEQRVLRAGSVGFRIGKRQAIDERDYSKGFKLIDNELHEFSLVDVGANPNALIAKALSALDDDAARKTASTFLSSSKTYVDFGATSQASDSPSQKSSKGKKPMKIEEQVVQLESELEEGQERLKSLAEAEVADDDMEQHETSIAELQDELESGAKKLKSLKRTLQIVSEKREKTIRTEKSVQTRVEEGESAGSDDDEYLKAMSEHPGTAAQRKEEDNGDLAIKTIAFMLKSHASHIYPLQLLEYEGGLGRREKAEMEVMLKAATNPADVPTAAWAGNLVQERWDNFVGLLRDISVYAALSPAYVRSLSFDRTGKINVPKNDGRGTLAGGFTAEGAPIPVKEGVIGITDLQPKALKVISAYTNELFRQSVPNIEQVIRDQILGDTAEALDTHLLGAAARTAAQPAGYQDATETGGGNINSATGSTVAAITADLQGMVDRALTARVSTAWTWIMSQSNLLYLRNKQDAASGVFSFREELNQGMLMGQPIITSQNVASTEVFLQGNGAVWQASAFAPNFVMSDSVLVMDDTAPEDIVSGGTATTQPTKSMFQTDSTALRMTWGLDYRIVRQGGVQVLDTVAWAT